MKNISFDEGYKSYAVNGDESRIIRLRAADPNLKERIGKLKNMVDEYFEKSKTAPNSDWITSADSELKALFNETFGTDICTPAFGNASLFTIVGEGSDRVPLFQAFFEAFVPVIIEDIKAASPAGKETGPRPEVKKYLTSKAPDLESMTAEEKDTLLRELLT